MSYEIGLDCKAYLDASGVGGSSWAEITDIESITLRLEHATAEVRNRSLTWAGILLGLKSGTIDIECTYDQDDTQYEALRDAWVNGSDIGIAISDEAVATVGANSFQADCKIVSFEREEPLEDVVKIRMSLQPSAESSTTPSYAETAGS